ncbi:hypothetical protein AVEN_164400-1, partial [Araneus ventricosus]
MVGDIHPEITALEFALQLQQKIANKLSQRSDTHVQEGDRTPIGKHVERPLFLC